LTLYAVKNEMKNFLLTLLAFTTLGACAQTRKKGVQIDNHAQSKNGIVKAQFFLQERMPGTLAVDENGKPVHQGPYLDYKGIVETVLGRQPVINKIWIDGTPFSVSTNEVASPYKVGVSKDSEQPIVVSAAKGNKIWELLLQKDETGASNRSNKNNSSAIVIEGTYSGKKFSLPVNATVKRLASPLYM
jgi:hypothetical protein